MPLFEKWRQRLCQPLGSRGSHRARERDRFAGALQARRARRVSSRGVDTSLGCGRRAARTGRRGRGCPRPVAPRSRRFRRPPSRARGHGGCHVADGGGHRRSRHVAVVARVPRGTRCSARRSWWPCRLRRGDRGDAPGFLKVAEPRWSPYDPGVPACNVAAIYYGPPAHKLERRRIFP